MYDPEVLSHEESCVYNPIARGAVPFLIIVVVSGLLWLALGALVIGLIAHR
jgi:hypothetical protein